jgi:hypothetical protein
LISGAAAANDFADSTSCGPREGHDHAGQRHHGKKPPHIGAPAISAARRLLIRNLIALFPRLAKTA